MKTFTDKEGQAFTVGKPIRTYHKGIYLLTRIEPRAGYSPLFHYKKVASGDCVPLGTSSIAKGVERECDSLWCKPLTADMLREELDAITKNYEATIKIIKSL